MSSICRAIIREHNFLPINRKTFAFYLRKWQICLFADRNARFGPVPTGIVPGGCDALHTPCRYGPDNNLIYSEWGQTFLSFHRGALQQSLRSTGISINFLVCSDSLLVGIYLGSQSQCQKSSTRPFPLTF